MARVTEQLNELVNADAGFAQKRSQSAGGKFAMQRNGQNGRFAGFAHVPMSAPHPQSLPSRLLKRSCRIVPCHIAQQSQWLSHLCLSFRFTPFLDTAFVSDFQPPSDSVADVRQRFSFRPPLRNAPCQCWALGDKPARFVLPNDDL